MWTVVAQTEMGARLHVPRRRMAVVGILSIGLAVLTGCLLGIPAIPRLVDRESEAFSWWWVVLAVVLGGVLLWPRLLNAVIARGLRVLGREPLEHELSGSAIALTSVWFVAAWVSTGLGTFLLARSVAPDAPLGPLLVTSVCGFALASAAGMFSFLVPAGVGVRDGDPRAAARDPDAAAGGHGGRRRRALPRRARRPAARRGRPGPGAVATTS